MSRRKKFDTLSVSCALVFAGIVAGAVYVAIDHGWFHTTWELICFAAVIALVGAVAVIEGVPVSPDHLAQLFRQSAHGRARDATEAETLASLGQADDTTSPQRRFPN